MKTLIVGTGVIGTIYGYLLREAGHEVTHLVRPGRIAAHADGIRMRLLDGRTPEVAEHEVTYRPRTIEALAETDDPDVILASVKHYQLPALLPVLAGGPAASDILMFTGLWTGLEPVDALLPRSRYLWGHPVAGGGFRDGVLDAAILPDVRLGEVAGAIPGRIDRVASLFASAGLQVDIRDDVLSWLWVHFAIEAAVIGCAIKAGDTAVFLDSMDRLEGAVLAVRDTLSVARARGADVDAVADAQLFALPPEVAAAHIHELYRVDRAARRIFECHTGGEELPRIYFDVLTTGHDLGVPMPTFAALEPHVAAFGLAAASA